MSEVKLGESIYIYRIDEGGKVIEGKGIVKKTSKKYGWIVAETDGENVTLDFRACQIKDDAMWSRCASRNVFIENMVEELMGKKEHYSMLLRETTKKINAVRNSVVYG